MILKIILAIVILTAVAVIALIINAVEDYNRKFDLEFSIKEALELANSPIITLNNNGKALNFLVDTGACFSMINKEIIPELNAEKCNRQGSAWGVSGEVVSVDYYTIELQDPSSGNTLIEDFGNYDLSTAFAENEKEFGIHIDGILGITFLSAYSCLIDFGKAKIYSKK